MIPSILNGTQFELFTAFCPDFESVLASEKRISVSETYTPSRLRTENDDVVVYASDKRMPYPFNALSVFIDFPDDGFAILKNTIYES